MSGRLPATYGIGNGRRWTEPKYRKKAQHCQLLLLPKWALDQCHLSEWKQEFEGCLRYIGSKSNSTNAEEWGTGAPRWCHPPQEPCNLQENSFQTPLEPSKETEAQLQPESAWVTYDQMCCSQDQDSKSWENGPRDGRESRSVRVTLDEEKIPSFLKPIERYCRAKSLNVFLSLDSVLGVGGL
jgi:hypothetical protein